MSIDIGKQFSTKLLNRNALQGDGKNTADEFREKFLGELAEETWWLDPDKKIELDFKHVEVMGPSWANEIFAYYVRFEKTPAAILNKLVCLNLTKTKEAIIRRELEQGYRGI